MKRLFVYGSLKKNMANHHLISRATENGRPAVISGTLYDAGWFPALDLDGGGEVSGEIYDIKDNMYDGLMSRLDSYEGRPHLFDRRQTVVRTDDGEMVSCEVYFGVKRSLFRDGFKVLSGVWE